MYNFIVFDVLHFNCTFFPGQESRPSKSIVETVIEKICYLLEKTFKALVQLWKEESAGSEEFAEGSEPQKELENHTNMNSTCSEIFEGCFSARLQTLNDIEKKVLAFCVSKKRQFLSESDKQERSELIREVLDVYYTLCIGGNPQQRKDLKKVPEILRKLFTTDLGEQDWLVEGPGTAEHFAETLKRLCENFFVNNEENNGVEFVVTDSIPEAFLVDQKLDDTQGNGFKKRIAISYLDGAHYYTLLSENVEKNSIEDKDHSLFRKIDNALESERQVEAKDIPNIEGVDQGDVFILSKEKRLFDTTVDCQGVVISAASQEELERKLTFLSLPLQQQTFITAEWEKQNCFISTVLVCYSIARFCSEQLKTMDS